MCRVSMVPTRAELSQVPSRLETEWPKFEYQLAHGRGVRIFPIWLTRDGDGDFKQKVSEYDEMREPHKLLAVPVHVNEVDEKLSGIADKIMEQL